MRAVIIAGGSGTRLRPLTYNTPKPMVPLFGKPFLQYQLELLQRAGVRDIVINVHYLARRIVDHFGDGRDTGLRLQYAEETRPLGTAGAVKLAEPLLGDEPIAVLNGDIFTDLDFAAMLAAHVAKKAVLTIALVRVADPTAFGLVFMQPDGRVTQFLEKPSWDEAVVDTVNAGIYLMDPAILRRIPPDEPHSFERELFPALLASGAPVYGHMLDGYWLDIGSPAKYMQAHNDVLLGRIKADLPATRDARGLWLGRDVEIASSAELAGPLFIGDGAKVGRHARLREFTVLGRGVTVGARAAVSHAVVGDAATIGDDAVVAQGIIGQRCAIGAGARIELPVVLADDSVLGAGTRLGPGGFGF